jgi:peptidoglycan/LPS O-acetylase OafA/YrhL
MLARMATIEGNQQANRLLRQVAFTSLILALLACFLNYPSMPIEKKSTWMAQCTSYIAGYGAFFAFLFFARGRWTERLSFMGAISYSIYLMHEPVQRLFQNTLPMDEPFWGGVYLLAALILPIPVSWIVYQLVERPSVRFGHKVANVKKPEGLRLA